MFASIFCLLLEGLFFCYGEDRIFFLHFFTVSLLSFYCQLYWIILFSYVSYTPYSMVCFFLIQSKILLVTDLNPLILIWDQYHRPAFYLVFLSLFNYVMHFLCLEYWSYLFWYIKILFIIAYNPLDLCFFTVSINSLFWEMIKLAYFMFPKHVFLVNKAIFLNVYSCTLNYANFLIDSFNDNYWLLFHKAISKTIPLPTFFRSSSKYLLVVTLLCGQKTRFILWFIALISKFALVLILEWNTFNMS